MKPAGKVIHGHHPSARALWEDLVPVPGSWLLLPRVPPLAEALGEVKWVQGSVTIGYVTLSKLFNMPMPL